MDLVQTSAENCAANLKSWLSSIERLVRLHLFGVLREECDSRVHKFGDGQVSE